MEIETLSHKVKSIINDTDEFLNSAEFHKGITAGLAPEASATHLVGSVDAEVVAKVPAVSVEDPTVNKAELARATANVRGQFVVVAAGTESAGAVVTVGATIFDKYLPTEITGI